MSNTSKEEIGSPAEALVSAWQERMTGDWPIWARMAVARFGRILLPSVSTGKFLRCFEKDKGFDNLTEIVSMPSVQGRFARVFMELKHNWPEVYREMSPQGPSPEEILKLLTDRVVGLPIKEQVSYWKGFSQGFSRPLAFNRDAKAFRFYLLIIIHWPRIEECRSIREAYELIFAGKPAEPCPPGDDPIDHQDAQFKWFEQLCHRGIGLKLGSHGGHRPPSKQNSIVGLLD